MIYDTLFDTDKVYQAISLNINDLFTQIYYKAMPESCLRLNRLAPNVFSLLKDDMPFFNNDRLGQKLIVLVNLSALFCMFGIAYVHTVHSVNAVNTVRPYILDMMYTPHIL